MVDFGWDTFEIASTLCEQLIIFYFICNFLKHDFKTPKGKIVYVFGSILSTAMITTLNFVTLYDWWLSVIYITFWFVFSLIFINGRVLSKLLTSILADVVSISTSNIVTGMMSVALKSTPSQLYTTQGWYRVLGVLMCQAMNLFLYSIILKSVNKTILEMKKKEWILIISVFSISTLSFSIIQIALNESRLSETTSLMLLLSEIGLIALNLICLYIMISLNQSNRAAEEFKLKEQQLKHDIQYAETVRSQYQEIRQIRHDIKQHLDAISGLQLEGKIDAAQKYIYDISSGLERIEMFMDVGNDFVNAILNSKLSIAKSKGIEVLCSSSSEVDGISEYDLCNLIGNMLDNAIEAAEKTGDNAIVEISFYSDKYKLMITVSNSILQSVLNGNSKLNTTKSKVGLHGFGIKTIKAIAEKYGGNADFYEENLTFFCRVILGKEVG